MKTHNVSAFLGVKYCVSYAPLAIHLQRLYKYKMKLKIFIYFLILLPTLGQAFAFDWQKDGERLTFDINWSFLRVGQAELLLTNNQEGYEIIGRAWTEKAYNTLYTLRDRVSIQGKHTEDQFFLTSSYRAQLNENDYRADKLVTFDHQKNICTYTNQHKNSAPTFHDVEPYSRDMISALYALRQMSDTIVVGELYTLPVMHYDRKYTYTLNVLKKERLKTIFGEKDVFQIQPILTRNDGKNKKRKDKLRLWVTADGQFTPVKIEIKLKVGTFRATLKKANVADSPSMAPKDLPEIGQIKLK